MASKYDQIYKNNVLQRWEDDSPEQKEIQDAIGNLVSNYDKVEIAESLKNYKNKKEDLANQLSKCNKEIKIHEKALVHILESTGESKFEIASGGSFFIQPKPRPTVKDANAFNKWAKENGYENHFGIHPKTLESIVNERLIDGLPLPPGIECFMDVKIGTRNVLVPNGDKSNDRPS